MRPTEDDVHGKPPRPYRQELKALYFCPHADDSPNPRDQKIKLWHIPSAFWTKPSLGAMEHNERLRQNWKMNIPLHIRMAPDTHADCEPGAQKDLTVAIDNEDSFLYFENLLEKKDALISHPSPAVKRCRYHVKAEGAPQQTKLKNYQRWR